MRNWGIGLIAFATLGFLGYLVDPEESLEAERNRTAVVVFVVMAGSGGVLFKKGQSYIDQMKNCAQKSLRHIREKGFIDSSGKLGHNLMDHVSTCRFFSLSKKFNNSKNEKNQLPHMLSGAGSFFIPFGNKPGIFNNVDFIRGYGIWGAIDRFEPPEFIKRNPDSKMGFLIGHGEVLPNPKNKVTLSETIDKWGLNVPYIDFKWRDNEKKMIKHMNKTIEDIIITAGGKVESINEIISIPFLKRILTNAIATQREAPPPGYYIHEVGGAPMGDTEESSVVDKWNKLWRCKNVLVVDGSCWPTSSWQSPTLTMMAITRRACLKALNPSKD